MSSHTLAPERLALIRLARADGVGPVSFRRLLSDHGGDPARALASLPRLAAPGGRPIRIPSSAEIEDEASRLDRIGARFLILDEPDYPAALATLFDAPSVLAVAGRVSLLATPMIAIVGARNASANGCRFAEALAAELSLAGVTVVSGLARGIDTAAHQGALLAGRTIAAIAGGLDRPYPPENAALQDAIAAHGGVVIAEQRLSTVPMARHFPRRNRIIAGLAAGCVIVEAAPRSGSLITARLALDAGREIFVVPGSPLDPRSRGSNDLLRRNEAHLCENAADILAVLPSLAAARINLVPARHRQARTTDPSPAGRASADPQTAIGALLALLGPSPTAIDDLVRRCQFSASVVTAALVDLELSGRVEILPGSRVCLLEG